MYENGYRNLQAAILTLAIFDFEKAIKKEKKSGKPSAERIALQKWFLSDWGELLSGGHGDYIISRCYNNVKEKRRSAILAPTRKSFLK